MGHVPAGSIPAEGQGAHVPRRQHRGVGAGRPSLNRRQLARAGELLAAAFLERRNVGIIARNVRVGRGEIDLVVELSGRRVAVEVKTIQTGGLDDPAFAFTATKAAQVRRLAGRLGIYRVDVIAVSLGSSGAAIRWIPEAG